MEFSEINAQYLRDNYLFGIPLEDIQGNKMGEELLNHNIRAALQYTQRTLQIAIEPKTIVGEIHDYYHLDYQSWCFLQLNKRPVSSVQSLSMYFGENKQFDIPLAWIRHYELSGQIQLFPVSGSTGSLILTQSGSFIPFTVGMYNNAPSVWRVSYTAGMAEIPDDLAEFIMKRASIGVLQVWGDLIIGAGIANQTISLDGLSQSIGTTQSPEFTGAGARIKNYQDDMKILEARLKDTYTGINMVVI